MNLRMLNWISLGKFSIKLIRNYFFKSFFRKNKNPKGFKEILSNKKYG